MSKSRYKHGSPLDVYDRAKMEILDRFMNEECQPKKQPLEQQEGIEARRKDEARRKATFRKLRGQRQERQEEPTSTRIEETRKQEAPKRAGFRWSDLQMEKQAVYMQALETPITNAKPRKIKIQPPKEKLQTCPVCGRSAKRQTVRIPRNIDVKGITIRVGQKLSLCSECGETFVGYGDDEDYLLDAYTIYMKRKDPSNRKFRQIRLTSGEAWVPVCRSCLGMYQLAFKSVPIPNKNKELTCCLKGCKATATHRVSLGKI